jgi:hypothetical protein
MKKITLLTPALLLIGCGSTPAPQQTQQQVPATQQQFQPDNAAPPVVAQQPFPATPNGSAVTQGSAAMPPQAPPPAQAEMQPGAPPPRGAEIAIPSGTAIRVRLNQTIDTRRNRSGDRFTASLAQPVVEQGRILVPQGTVFTGHVTTSTPSGRMKGRAVIGLTLDSFKINGANYPVVTTGAGRVSARHKKRNLVLIGGGSGLGALIGGLAGGGKGALIGAGAGAGAGTAGAAATGKKDVTLPAETLLTFRLEENVEL